MFNPLLDDMPLDFEGLKLKTDFRQVLKFFRLQDDTELEQKEKYELTAMCFFDTPYLTQKMVDFIGYYIRGGEEPSKEDNGEAVFDWNIDSYLIYSAFQQVYKIDLTTEHMHWWKFLALYKGLPAITKLADVIKTRAMPVPPADKYNRDYVRNLTELKRYYALKQNKKEIGNQIQSLFEVI